MPNFAAIKITVLPAPILSESLIRTESIDIGDFGPIINIRREDLLHPHISGNKYRKLKYNIAFAKANDHKLIITYGGAFSNHIAATAAAGREAGLQTIGIIRGEELGSNIAKTLQENKTLAFAVSQGMQLKFITRQDYREKTKPYLSESLHDQWGSFYELPEGGTNELAVKGCKEILTQADESYDYICCSGGTGGTAAGIIEASAPHQKILVFSALKGDFLREEIRKYTSKTNWQLMTDYHFGGYARVNEALIRFINSFKEKHKIQLDPIYTGKMMYGLMAMAQNGIFSRNTRILAIHTGGLQGIKGINDRLRAKNAPCLIHIDD